MDILLLKLGDTIQGEVTLDGYAGQIEILSFSHGISQSVVHGLIGRTGTVGPKHQDFTLSKYVDLASTGILDACDRGAVIPRPSSPSPGSRARLSTLSGPSPSRTASSHRCP